MKIIHLTTDEKFIDGAMFIFNKAFPKQNKLFVLKSPANPPIRFIRQSKIDAEIVKSEKSLAEVKTITKDADWIVVHGLNETWARFILENNEQNILYVVWGAEVYGNPYLYDIALYGDYTERLAKKLEKKSFIQKVKDTINTFRFNLPTLTKEQQWKLNKQAFQKLKYISVIYKEEIDFYKENNIVSNNAKFIKFGYYPIEYITKDIDEEITLGTNIMIGNSSSLSNNHLEVLYKLKKLEVKNKILVPLSYGDKRLAKHIEHTGQDLFGNQFTAITEFMPLNEYTTLMQSCGIVIMNHYRQQAVGNIITAMYLGAKVFLDERNTIYRYLKRIGCHVYKISEIKCNDDLAKLELHEIKENRELLINDISSKLLIDNIINNL